MIWAHVLPRYGEAFLRLFYPSFCATCQHLLDLKERGLCLACRESLQKLRLLPSEERIRVSLVWGDEAWSLFRYEGAVKDVFHKIKFERRRDLLPIFRPAIEGFFRRRPQLAAYDYLIPIPLDWRRRLEREFNQSELLSRSFDRILRKQKRHNPPRLQARGLRKLRPTPPQSLLGREERRFNLEGIFRVSWTLAIENRSVLLVDDIFTTGATLEEAAKVLKQAGASRVGSFTLARVFAH